MASNAGAIARTLGLCLNKQLNNPATFAGTPPNPQTLLPRTCAPAFRMVAASGPAGLATVTRISHLGCWETCTEGTPRPRRSTKLTSWHQSAQRQWEPH